MPDTPRIGIGFDAHRLVEGRRLVLGGVEVPFPKGLEGHSDADVLAHAITDALLGALGLGDIGQHFPDTDSRYKDADSLELLAEVAEMVRRQGFALGNLDATIIAEVPKLLPYLEGMRNRLAGAIGCRPDQVNLKATTTEGLGFTGRQEGIAALATVLLIPAVR